MLSSCCPIPRACPSIDRKLGRPSSLIKGKQGRNARNNILLCRKRLVWGVVCTCILAMGLEVSVVARMLYLKHVLAAEQECIVDTKSEKVRGFVF